MDELKPVFGWIVLAGVGGLLAGVLICGLETSGFNTHPKAAYIVVNRCAYKEHVYLPVNKVVTDEGERDAPAMSWDRWECPNGQVVTIAQSPAIK